jgi:hypothetical protein
LQRLQPAPARLSCRQLQHASTVLSGNKPPTLALNPSLRGSDFLPRGARKRSLCPIWVRTNRQVTLHQSHCEEACAIPEV